MPCSVTVCPTAVAAAMAACCFFAAAALALVFAAATPFAAENNYVPTRTILQQTDVPGSNYTVTAVFTSTNSNFADSSSAPPTPLVVTQEDARATYTGTPFAWTSSATFPERRR